LIGSATDELVPVVLRLTVTAANMPGGMVVLFIPLTRHFMLPFAVLQSNVFPAAAKAEAAVVLTDAISAAGNESAQSTPDGAFPVFVSDTFRVTEPPRIAEPEDNVNTLCA
jgi:hypothetical protein